MAINLIEKKIKKKSSAQCKILNEKQLREISFATELHWHFLLLLIDRISLNRN